MQIALTLETLMISGFYPHLHGAHQNHDDYFKSLPLLPTFWIFKDTLFLLTINIVIDILLISPFVYSGINNFWQAVRIIMLQMPLCIILYPIRNKLKRQGAVVAIITASLWGWLTIYLLGQLI